MATPAVKRDKSGKKKEKQTRDQNSRLTEALDASLKLILDSLAGLLVESGYGYARLAKIAKVAFVQTANSIDQEGSSRVSYARIAALTGLTRTDVSHLLRGQVEGSVENAEPENRVLRVARGWSADMRYARQDGSPRSLPFKGTGASFSSLVKKYSGDIPARAMLSEMKRLGMVKHDSQDRVLLVRESLGVSRTTTLAVKAISPWVEMLATRNGSRPLGDVTSKAKQVHLGFSSTAQLLAAVREIEHRRLALVSGLAQLGETEPRRRKYILKVSIAVAAERSSRKTKHRNEKRAENI